MKTCFSGIIFLGIVVLIVNAQKLDIVTKTNAAASISYAKTDVIEEKIEEYPGSGEMVAVNAGRRFAIRLRSNPTTGYGWQLAKPLDGKIVAQVTNDYVHAHTGRIGAGGHEVWIFKAVGQGQTEISLKYVRSWEKDRPPAQTNVLTVVVK